MKVFMMILIAISVCAIYDARIIANKHFSNVDSEIVVKNIRIIAFCLSIICSLVYYFI